MRASLLASAIWRIGSEWTAMGGSFAHYAGSTLN